MADQTFFKILSHDLRPPMQGGAPLPLEKLPFTTEKVRLDTTSRECAAGWHVVDDMATGFKITGLWRNGRPARVFEAEPSDDVIQRGNKFRCSELTIVKELDLEGIERGIYDLSEPFGRFRDEMVAEQLGWYQALARPENDPECVEAGLRAALEARDLKWDLKRYDNARDARDAWDARAAWAAWDARAAWDAWDALSVSFAAKQGWIDHPDDLLTTGLRVAYKAGLGIVIPTGPNELGWTMDVDG